MIWKVPPFASREDVPPTRDLAAFSQGSGAGPPGWAFTTWYRYPPSPLVLWNHGVSGDFMLWSLKNKDLYQSIPE
jgi:hypothetical protein